jgi:hypothetical protein
MVMCISLADCVAVPSGERWNVGIALLVQSLKRSTILFRLAVDLIIIMHFKYNVGTTSLESCGKRTSDPFPGRSIATVSPGVPNDTLFFHRLYGW